MRLLKRLGLLSLFPQLHQRARPLRALEDMQVVQIGQRNLARRIGELLQNCQVGTSNALRIRIMGGKRSRRHRRAVNSMTKTMRTKITASI